MERIILLGFRENRTQKTKRWLGLLTFCMMLFVGQLSFAQTYCTPTFGTGCTSGDQIDSFTIPAAGFSHLDTGCSADGYGDFTAMAPISLYIGAEYDFTITHGFSTQLVRIWIDFDNDGTFDDSTGSIELVAAAASTGSGANTVTNGTIEIPASVSPGTYRMRVVDRYGSANTPTPCNTAGFGEAHDYMVSVTAPPACAFPPSGLTATNITINSAELGWSEPGSATSWDIEWGLDGFTPSGTPTVAGVTNPYSLGGLTPYTDYQFYVRSDCGSGNLSPWQGPFSFKTLYDCTAYTGNITSVDGGGICDEGTTTLGVTASGVGNQIYWYDAAVGGNIVGFGTSFETPSLTETTSYWAAEVSSDNTQYTGQGLNNPTTGTGSTLTTYGVAFTANEPMLIETVDIYSTGTISTTGEITINLIDNNNGNVVIASTTVTLTTAGTTGSPELYTVPLNFYVPAAGDYRLVRAVGNTSSLRTVTGTANLSFPYDLGGLGEITSGATSVTGTTTATYYYFFNWSVRKQEFFCESDRVEVVATVHEIIGADITATATSVNSGSPTTLTASSTNTNYTYAWSWAGGSDTGAEITVSPTAHTTYTVTATDSVTGCQTTSEIDILVFDTTLCDDLEIEEGQDGAVCDEGVVALGVIASNTGSGVRWYDAAVDGNLVGMGTSFETPSLTETTSYWASEVLLEDTQYTGQGLNNPTTGTGSTLTNYGVAFTANEPMLIETVDIYSTGTISTTGEITINLIDNNNGNVVIASTTVTLTTAGTTGSPELYTVPLNFYVPAAGNYRLIRATGNSSSLRTVTGAANLSFPYDLGGLGEITSGVTNATTGTTATTYYYFFNWSVRKQLLLCESDREEVVATVHQPDAVVATSSAVPTNAVAPNGSTTLTASSTNDPNYTYVWEPAALIAGSNTGASVTTAALTEHTTFTVTATDTVTGCTTATEIEILVFDITDCDDLEILTAMGETVCNGETATLTATASGTGDAIYWFDAATGGNMVGEGATFETPELTETTSYWAAEVVADGQTVAGQGKPAMTLTPASGTSTSGVNWGHVFDAYEGFTIAEADMYSTGAGGDITIQIQTHPGGVMVDEVTITVPGGGTPTAPVLFTSVLNLEVPEAGTYRMLRTSSNPATVNMVRESSGNTYPYPLGTSGSITGGWIAGSASSTAYYWFYNLKVSTGNLLCESDRVEAIVTVNAPAVPAGDANQDVAEGSTLADLVVTASGTLTWYADEALTTVLSDTDVVAETTYYVTNTEASCESDALAVTVTTFAPPFPAPYCNVTFPSGVEPITLVQFGTIDNATSNAINGTPALEDFTAISTDVQQTESYTITLKGNTDGPSFTNYFNVFIDWNQDGDFDDAGESYEIGTIAGSTGLDAISASGVIVVPADAELGATRMRVVKRFNQYGTACNTAGYGQAEDYTVNVLPAPPCPKPTALSHTQLSMTSAELSWASTGTTFEIKWDEAGFDVQTEGILIPSTDITGTSHTLTGLTADTEYEFYVLRDCGTDGVSDWVGPYSFSVGYCAVSTTNTGDYINAFSTTGAVSNISYTAAAQPAGSYDNQTSQLFQQAQGGTIDFTSTFIGGTWGLRIWVDVDGDGVFDDSTEMVFNSSIATGAKTGSIVVPEILPVGEYRVRVRGQFNALPPACGNVNYGSTIDFTLEVLPAPACPTPTALSHTQLSITSAELSWTSTGTDFEIKWDEAGFDVQTEGILIPSADITGTSYTLTGLTADTEYEFYVLRDCGATDGVSSWAGPYSFSVGYCVPTGASNNTDEIINFTLSNIDNDSDPSEGTAGYMNYSNTVTPADLTIGTPYVASLTSGPGTGNHGAAIWIDYNNNGTFEEDEKVAWIGNTIGANATVDFPEFTVPDTVTAGIYRLRVQYRFNISGENLDPCVASMYAETEDYAVNIIAATDPCATLLAPTGDDEQTVDLGATIADLTVTGETGATFTWYSDLTLDTVVTETETFDQTGEFTYYVTQTVGSCTSDAFAVTITVVDPCAGTPLPTAASPQPMTVGATVADIVVTDVTGTLNWYDDNGDSINDSLVLTEGVHTFYVSQTIDGCESDTIEVIVEVTLSTNVFDNASFRAYPNPVKDFFNVSYSKDITNIEVINMLGQVVITKTVNATESQIDMTSLPTGSYFVKVTADGAVKTVKVIKN